MILVDVITDVCRGAGHYLGEMNTFERMKSDYFYPKLGDRRTPEEWEADGSKPVGAVAKAKTKNILANHYPIHIADQIDLDLRKHFDIRLSREQIGRTAE